MGHFWIWFYISDALHSRSCRSVILPPLKQVWLLENRYYSVNMAKPPFAAGDILMLKETYGKEGQVFGSSRSRMYTVRWICMWNNIHNLRSCTGEYFQKPKRLHKSVQLSNPSCFDSEGEPPPPPPPPTPTRLC